MKENSIPVQRIVPNRRLVLNERFFGTAIFFHNVINFSTFQPFHPTFGWSDLGLKVAYANQDLK